MSADVLSLLSRKAAIRRPTRTQDSSGSPVSVFATTRFNVPCALDQMSGNESQRYARETSVGLYSAMFLPGAGVDVKDVVEIDGLTFEVLNTNICRGEDGVPEYLAVDLELTK